MFGLATKVVNACFHWTGKCEKLEIEYFFTCSKTNRDIFGRIGFDLFRPQYPTRTQLKNIVLSRTIWSKKKKIYYYVAKKEKWTRFLPFDNVLISSLAIRGQIVSKTTKPLPLICVSVLLRFCSIAYVYLLLGWQNINSTGRRRRHSRRIRKYHVPYLFCVYLLYAFHGGPNANTTPRETQ